MEKETGYVNKNCWLAKNLGYPPSNRCKYCELRFRNCVFEQYLVITLILICALLCLAYLIEKNISKSLIISLFVLVISYGYFFNKSTEKIIISNFEEKKAKNAFKDLNDNLQEKVDEQTKEIKEQKNEVQKAYDLEKKVNEELKHLDEAKTQFMLITQHHLRTPLSVNRGFLDLIKKGRYGKIPAKLQEPINELCDSTIKEIKVVNELLDVSSYQLGKKIMNLELEVDIENLIEETLKDLKIQAKNKGIYLKFEKQNNISKISADSTKLKLALTNIIDNCVKYTQKGGVEIKIKTENDKLKIEIKDTGMGIPKDKLQNIFKQAFHRSKQAQKIFAVGKGIGLYLSGKIIEGHNGKIWAESDGEGKGSIFYIELPINNKNI